MAIPLPTRYVRLADQKMTSQERYKIQKGYVQTLTLDSLHKKLQKADASFNEETFVNLHDKQGLLPIELLWKRVALLAKEHLQWDRPKENKFIYSVRKLEELADEGFEIFKNNIDCAFGLMCCYCLWCRCPSTAESEAKKIASDLEVKHQVHKYPEIQNKSRLLDEEAKL